MDLKKLNLTKEDTIYLLILFIFSSLCTLKMMFFSMSGGILNPDIALYLLTGLKYAGLDFYNVVYPEDIFYTPIISFLTSIFFRFGYVDKNAIIFVSSIFSFLSYIGLYFLLKERFDSLLSLTGVIIYGSLSITILNISKGMIDIPAISISIWSLLFSIIAIDKKPKYFLISLPLLVIGFFTKYIVGFTLPLILLYYVMNRNIIDLFDNFKFNKKAFQQKLISYFHSKEFKYISLSIFISLILTIIICKYLILDFGGSLTFFEQSANTFNGYNFSSSGIDFNIDKSYYFDHFSDIIFESRTYSYLLAGLLYGIIGLGVLVKAITIFKNYDIFKENKRSFKTKNFCKILWCISIILILLSFFIFKEKPNHMVSNICVLIALTLIFSILEKYTINRKFISLDILFIAYFLINFIFISVYATKVPRYALMIIPPFIYFIIWGLSSIIDGLKDYNLNFKSDKILPIGLILIFIIVTSTFIIPMEFTRSNDNHIDVNYKGFASDLVDVCDLIKNNDSNCHNKTFASYYHHSRIIRWYLNVNVSIIDYDDSIKSFNETDYIILNENKTANNYYCVNKGDFYIYSHK